MRDWLKGFGIWPAASHQVARRPRPVTIRRAAPADIVAVRSMLVTTWHETYDAWLGAATVTEISTRWHSLERLRQETTLPQAAFLIAEAPLRGRLRTPSPILGTAFAYLADADSRPIAAAGDAHDPDQRTATSRPASSSRRTTSSAAGRAEASPDSTTAPRPATTPKPATAPPSTEALRTGIATPAPPSCNDTSSESAGNLPAHVEIGRLYVATDMQGRGIGHALIEAIFAAFPGAAAYRLDVDPRNTRAIDFYERHGFTVTDDGADCGGSGLSHLVMTRRGDGTTGS